MSDIKNGFKEIVSKNQNNSQRGFLSLTVLELDREMRKERGQTENFFCAYDVWLGVGSIAGGGSQIREMYHTLRNHFQYFRNEVKISFENIFQRPSVYADNKK